MTDADSYVTTDPSGVIRVGKAAVSLESVLAGIEQGHTPERIGCQYAGLTLEEVYGAARGNRLSRKSQPDPFSCPSSSMPSNDRTGKCNDKACVARLVVATSPE